MQLAVRNAGNATARGIEEVNPLRLFVANRPAVVLEVERAKAVLRPSLERTPTGRHPRVQVNYVDCPLVPIAIAVDDVQERARQVEDTALAGADLNRNILPIIEVDISDKC